MLRFAFIFCFQMVSLSQFSNAFRDASLSLFYPQGCSICGESVETSEEGAVCDECWNKTRLFDGSETICYRCGALLETGRTNREIAERIFCRRCDESFFDAARATGVYEGALRAAVLSLKREPFVSEKLKDLFFAAFERPPLNEATKIVPVPLHPKRERERGFNQAAVLAKILGGKSGLPVLENCLVRVAHTNRHRAGMDEKARRESVEKSFAVKNKRLIESEKLLLVDDVFTTGATVSTCAQILKENGAGEVFVLTIARAV